MGIPKDIAATAKERKLNHTQYVVSMENSFARLHKILNQECALRKEQCEVFSDFHKEFYKKLNQREDAIEVDVHAIYDDLVVDLKVEETERIASQDNIVANTTSFLDQFKENITQDLAKQRDLNAARRKKLSSYEEKEED